MFLSYIYGCNENDERIIQIVLSSNFIKNPLEEKKMYLIINNNFLAYLFMWILTSLKKVIV